MVTTRRKSGDSSGATNANDVVNTPPHLSGAGEKDATDASHDSKGVKRRSDEVGVDQHESKNGEREEPNDGQETNETGADNDRRRTDKV